MAKMLKRKNINFYAAFYRKPPLNKEELKKKTIIIAPIAIIIALLLIVGVMYCQMVYAILKTETINEYLSKVDIKEAVETTARLEDEKELCQSEMKFLESAKKIISEYPSFSTTTFSQIYGTAKGGTVYESIDYNSESGLLTVTALAPKMEYAADSTASLRKLGIFSNVAYEGYELEGKEGQYAFNVYAVMKGGDSL